MLIDHGLDAVDDEADDVAVNPESSHSLQDGCQRQAGTAAVDDEDDRRVCRCGQFIGTGLRTCTDAVVVAHGPFQNGYISRSTMAQQRLPGSCGARLVAAEEKEVQIIRRRIQDPAVEHGVDIIRTALESGRQQAAVLEGL